MVLHNTDGFAGNAGKIDQPFSKENCTKIRNGIETIVLFDDNTFFCHIMSNTVIVGWLRTVPDIKIYGKV